MANPKQCKTCKRTLGKKTKLQCGDCKGYFHLECGGVSELDARIMQSEKTPWICAGCLDESATTASRRQSMLFSQHGNASARRSDVFNRPTGEPSYSGDMELKILIRELQEEMKEMRKTMEFFNEKYEEEAKRNKVLADMVSEVSRDNQELRKEIQKLKSTVNAQENSKLKSNITISGLLDVADDGVVSKEKITKLVQGLNVNCNGGDFENIKIYEINNGAKAVVTLRSLELKQTILKARAQKGKISIRSLGLGESSRAIFIDEDLSKEMYALFKKAREQLKEKNYKYVWHRNGRVLARKSEGDRYVVIRGENDLEELL